MSPCHIRAIISQKTLGKSKKRLYFCNTVSILSYLPHFVLPLFYCLSYRRRPVSSLISVTQLWTPFCNGVTQNRNGHTPLRLVLYRLRLCHTGGGRYPGLKIQTQIFPFYIHFFNQSQFPLSFPFF